jgi:hypothetical protein
MKNIEYRTPNVEGMEKLFIAFKVFYLHPSTFDIHYSTFDIQKTEPFGSGYAGLCNYKLKNQIKEASAETLTHPWNIEGNILTFKLFLTIIRHGGQNGENCDQS